ncbi:class I SAM-dependent methyltransferase [Streptomyces sp. G2]|uniref:class I SAM-dependent methyltransferase n=1 Tax=Streptomyces TaxID=1883 RepID=UPI00202DD593|nr:class I SAM-dependent methyltransferase [Streptomyces sp. G2]MCM1951178.1 class I SAM-dependent methyltransferase [Streptomyces sp. G2]
MDINLDYFSQSHWDRVARARGTASSEVGTVLIDSVVTRVREGGAQDVLDIGSGNGALACALVTAMADARVTGLDYSPAAVRLAVEELLPTLPPADRTRLSFSAGSADALPFEDDRFDAVTMLKTAWVLPDLPAALRECRRVLRPGGSIHIQSWADPEQCAALTLGGDVLADSISGFTLPPEAMAPFELTPDRVVAELTGAGFRMERQHSFSWDLTVGTASEYWDRLRSIAGTAYWAFAVQPNEDRPSLDTTWRRYAADYTTPDDTWNLPLAWHISTATA